MVHVGVNFTIVTNWIRSRVDYMGMKAIVVCAGTLNEAFAMLHEALVGMSEQVKEQIKEFNDLIRDACMYEEELEFNERISFPCNVVKVLKSQVLNRKPMLIRARTTC